LLYQKTCFEVSFWPPFAAKLQQEHMESLISVNYADIWTLKGCYAHTSTAERLCPLFSQSTVVTRVILLACGNVNMCHGTCAEI
jgi:hypothetical protein